MIADNHHLKKHMYGPIAAAVGDKKKMPE